MTEYDIGAAFRAIEEELMASMMRNMERHRAEETQEGIEWSQWQAEQLKALEKYKQENREKYKEQFRSINREIEVIIHQARQVGNMDQEIKILQSIKKGFKVQKNKTPAHQAMTAKFFKLNDRKLEALIKATTHDMEKAETAILRRANDQYRKAIFNAQVYANTGSGTYEKAVDMAVKDMLSHGLNCVEYANGTRHTLSDYADMAIRTASKRAYLTGEGEKRMEWGISTVIVNKRGNPCPKCLPFCGKVMIDDVWSGGKPEDGPYPLMSKAVAAGLYHPRCKDSHTTYFPGISTADDTWTEKELGDIGEVRQSVLQGQEAMRQAAKYMRLAKYLLDDENKREYARKAREWNRRAKTRFADYDELEKYMNVMYNAHVDDDVKELNLRQVSVTITEFEKVMEEFPSIQAYFSGLNTANRGYCAVVPNGELLFNPVWYKHLNRELIGSGYHEAGHLIELALIYSDNMDADLDTVMDLWQDGKYAKEIVMKAYNRISTHKSLKELRLEISQYSMKSYSETLADSIRDYFMNGYRASLLSIQIIKVLKGVLR